MLKKTMIYMDMTDVTSFLSFQIEKNTILTSCICIDFLFYFDTLKARLI